MSSTINASAPPVTARPRATRAVIAVAAAITLSRLAVAMTPLALVFLSRERAGGYGSGAALAACYAVAEAVGALVLGPRLDRRPIRRQLSGGMLVSAAAFGVLGTAVPLGAAAVLVALAGLAAAGAPGGLRTLLGGAVPANAVAAAFSLEMALTQAVWAVSPALVGMLALGVSARVPFLLAAIAMLGAALTVAVLPVRAPVSLSGTTRGRAHLRTLWGAWPIYLTSAGAMYLLATVELLLPALLEYRGVPLAWAGPLLAGFSVASIAGAVAYGARGWPGTPRVHSIALLLTVGLLACGLTALHRPAAFAVALGAAGFVQAALLTARNLSLRDRLPAHAHAGGYSLLYAGSAAGYAISGVVAGMVLAAGSPVRAVAAGAGAVILIAAASALVEARDPRP